MHDFVGRAWIRGRLEDDQDAGAEVLRDCFDGGHDVRHVRIFRLAKRRRHADVDGVEFLDDGEVRGRVELAGLSEGADLRRGHVRDVRLPIVDCLDLAAIEIDAGRVEPRLGELHGKGQPDVSQADDAGSRPATRDLFLERRD